MLRTKVKSPIISYKNLRRLIGILGMLLPLVCFLGGLWFGHLKLQRSISFYYYTNVRDVLVGLLIGVGMFLTTYNGYEKIDSIVSKVTGFAGLGIAIFPCLSNINPVGFFQLQPQISNGIHLTCASLFFILLAINSIFLFTITSDRSTMTQNKKKRNVVYVTCGVIILLSIISLVIIELTVDPIIIKEKCLVFILETIMLEAFGISWLVKGETIFRD